MNNTKDITLESSFHYQLDGCTSLKEIGARIKERVQHHNRNFPENPLVSWRIRWEYGYGEADALALKAIVKLSPEELAAAKKASAVERKKKMKMDDELQRKEYEDYLKLKAKFERSAK